MTMIDPGGSWANREDVARRPEAAVEAIAQPRPFWSAVGRGFTTSAEDQWRNRTGGWREQEWRSALIERNMEVERITGQRMRLSAEGYGWEAGPEANREGLAGLGVAWDEALGAPARAVTGAPSIAEYEAQLDALRARFPELARVPTRAQLWARHDADLTAVRQRAVEAGADGPGGAIGGFTGGVVTGLADPQNVGAMALTGGVGAGRGLLTRMVIQSGVNAGVEVTQVPGRMTADQYGGPGYSLGEAAQDVSFAAIGGAGFEALGDGLKYGTRPLREALGLHADPVVRAMAEAIDEGSRRPGEALTGAPDPAARGWAQALEGLQDDEAVIGPGRDFDAARAALARGEVMPRVEPDRDLEALFPQGDLPPVSGGVRQMQPAAGGLTPADYHGRTIWAGRFDPLALEVDAARFQYKADGDAEGVTARLRGIERWDTTASGKALIFEALDGRLIVADGHQRRGLARRLAEQGWEDAQLDGYLFRERDGWTAREVRVVAALKNMREGSGTPLDAAKLFREAPAALRDRSLPITGEVVAQGRQLASLSEGAFKAVVNGVVPERYGAIIGEQAGTRPELHDSLIDLLRRADPRTTEGARAMVQEGLLDDFIRTEGLQLDLFGGLPRESTLIARGRIREAVMAGLRKDARLNAALVRNAEAIEAGGNVLARSANEAALAIDRAASELVSRLALRSGEMGEAFAAAAAAVTKGEISPGAAAKALIQRIRAAVKAGESLEAARADVLDPPAPSPAAMEAVQAFDTPGGAAQRAQLAPKPEEAGLEADPATAGLFDDLPEDDGLDRALQHLTACAPGRG